jgi:hypothetical protein
MPATALASQNTADVRSASGMSGTTGMIPGAPDPKLCSPNEVPNLQHAVTTQAGGLSQPTSAAGKAL